MTNLERVKLLLEEIKSGTDSKLKTNFSEITTIFPSIPRDERKKCTDDFYKWAFDNKDTTPLKFAYATVLVALDYFFTEDYETTLVHTEEAQRLFKEQNDPDGLGICLVSFGGTYRTLGNLDLSLNALWEGHEILKKSGAFPHFFMATGFQIASIYVDLKHYDEAIPLYKSTLELAEKHQNMIWIFNCIHGLAKVYLAQKDYDKAKETLEHGKEFAEKSSYNAGVANADTDLAQYYFETGDFLKAEQFQKNALAIREERKIIGGAITNCIRLGEIYVKLSMPDEAIAFLNKGLAMAEQIKVKPKMYQIQLLLSEIYQKKNELNKSLEHYKLFHELREQVEVEDAAKKVKNLQLLFTAEQTRKENEIIKAQKKEIEQKNTELQRTIDELTRTKVGKKAKIFTLAIAIVLFLFEEVILHSVTHLLPEDSMVLSFIVKAVIILALKPIDNAIEHYLLKKIIREKKIASEGELVAA